MAVAGTGVAGPGLDRHEFSYMEKSLPMPETEAWGSNALAERE